MEITLDTLLYKLKDLKPVVLLHGDHKRTYHGIKHLTRNSAQYQADYIYGIRLSWLYEAAAPINYSLTYLCINDLNKSPEELRQHDLNIILFDPSIELEYLFNRVLDIYNHLEKWANSMHIYSLKGKSPQHLVDLSEGFIEHPMVIFDPSFGVLAYTKHIHTDYIHFNQTIKHGYSPPEVIKTLEKTTLFQQLYTKNEPVIQSAAGCKNLTNIYVKIEIKGNIAAYISIFCKEPPAQGYIDTMKLFLENLTLYFQQFLPFPRTGNFMYESFLQDLLDRKDISLSRIEDQLKYITELPLRSYFKLVKLVFSVLEGIPLAYLARDIAGNINNVRPFIYNGDLYLLRDYSTGDRAAKSFSDQELHCLDAILTPYDYVFGVSDVFNNITDIKIARSQCEAAIRLRDIKDISYYSKAVNLNNDTCNCLNDRVFEYACLSPFHMIDLAAKEYPVASSLSSNYLRLVAYDNENQTDYSQFLKIYLFHERNSTKTAQAMFLHRNTVIYRIQKIQEILSCDFERIETRQEFIQSFLIQEYLNLRLT